MFGCFAIVHFHQRASKLNHHRQFATHPNKYGTSNFKSPLGRFVRKKHVQIYVYMFFSTMKQNRSQQKETYQPNQNHLNQTKLRNLLQQPFVRPALPLEVEKIGYFGPARRVDCGKALGVVLLGWCFQCAVWQLGFIGL